MLTDIKWGHATENALYFGVNSVFTLFLRKIHSDKNWPEKLLHVFIMFLRADRKSLEEYCKWTMDILSMFLRVSTFLEW